MPPPRCPQLTMSASLETPKVKTDGRAANGPKKAIVAYECNAVICAASRTRGSWGTRCPKRSSLSARSYLIDLCDQELHIADAPPLIQQQHGLLEPGSLSELPSRFLLRPALHVACPHGPPTRITAASSDQRRGPAFSRQSDIAHST
ncbi:hypothetical protein COCCADRAFT_41192 [Bipolaris zeicola 26-R-13]|uniref:Uncharacterized protein n=1 Tax=Cochliobolus carbonum (strain 26-R-13) TaxID=930089 RepID=W6XZV7_COCC2|nr:uncharacterized protein COCCADRAFT_41192 [Bipolaris zeicola 26-R-13]EUC28254.1 hypothetical protein COCCADRAFT_41192 [Bipolaris zeicola 26-R-13]